MSLEDANLLTDPAAQWLLEFDEALAAGRGLEAAGHLTPLTEGDAELKAARACLQLLEKVWPRGPEKASDSLACRTDWQSLPQLTAAPELLSFSPRGEPVRIGRFQILGKLGQGGGGLVFLGFDPVLGRKVALKVPRMEALMDPELRRRFLREAQAAAGLDHPNLVPVYEAGEVGSVCYIASAYCEGTTLATWLHEHREPIGPQAAAELVATLAVAVEYIHTRGILHRDLKPSNILLESVVRSPQSVAERQTVAARYGLATTDYGLPKITDFGLAKLLDRVGEETKSGVVLGTPSYMAPEQAESRLEEIGPHTDVYALGAILYELLTGRPPFRGTGDLETLRQVVAEEPVSPSLLRPKPPRDLVTICLKCLQKEPRKRYRGALALADDLHRFLAGKPIQARPIGVWERGWKWARRRPTTASLVAVSVVAALSLLIGGLWYNAQLRAALQATEDRRREADTNLYHALVREAQTIRQSRVTGYRSEAWKRLRQALELETPAKDVLSLRKEAAACLGDFVGLEPTIWEFQQTVPSCALHPDGRQVALGLSDGTLLVRDIAGREVTQSRSHRASVGNVAFGPDGKRLVSAGLDGTLKVWEPNANGIWTPTRTLTADQPEYVGGVDAPLISIAFGPDSRYLAGCCSGRSTIWLWDLADGSLTAQFRGQGKERFYCLALSPDGKLLAAGYHHGRARGVLVWEVATRQLKPPLSPSLDYVYQVVFSPDGRFLALAGGAGGIILYDTADFQRRLFAGGDVSVGVAFGPDSQMVAIPAYHTGLIRLWNISTNRDVAVLKGPGHPHTLGFSTDGKTLVTAGETSVRIWHLGGCDEKLVLSGHDAPIDGLTFSPDGKLLASGGSDRKLKIWDPATGRLLKTLTGFSGMVQTVAFSPDSRLLATGEYGPGSAIRIWEGGSWQELVAPPHELGDRVWVVAFSRDGRYFAACGGLLTGGPAGVILWRMESGPTQAGKKTRLSWEKLDQLSNRPTSSLCFSSDSRLLAWLEDPFVPASLPEPDGRGRRPLCLWDVGNRRELPAPPAQPFQSSFALAFRAEARELVLIGPTRGPEVWDVDTRRKTFSLESSEFERRTGMSGGVLIGLSADGTWLAQGAPAVPVWDLENKTLLLILPEERSVPFCFAWSPNKELLAIGSQDGGLVIWNMPKIRLQLAEIGLAW